MIGYLEKKKKSKLRLVHYFLIKFERHTPILKWKKWASHRIEAFLSGGEREWRVQTKETRFYISHMRNVPVCSGKYIQ